MSPIEILTLAPPHVASEAIRVLTNTERRLASGEIDGPRAREIQERLLEAVIEARKTAAAAHDSNGWASRSRVARA